MQIGKYIFCTTSNSAQLSSLGGGEGSRAGLVKNIKLWTARFKGVYGYLANKLTRLLSAMSGRNKNFDVMAT